MVHLEESQERRKTSADDAHLQNERYAFDCVRSLNVPRSGVKKGCCTPQLQRVNWSGKPYAREECAFAIFGSQPHAYDSVIASPVALCKSMQDRTIDLECKNEKERDRWVEAIEALLQYAEDMKLWGEKTMGLIKAQKEADDDGDD